MLPARKTLLIGLWAMSSLTSPALGQGLRTTTPATSDATDPAVNAQIAERAATLLERRYVSPALGARYAAMLRRNAKDGGYAKYTDPGLLAKRMTQDLQDVAPDGHLQIRRANNGTPPPTAPSPVPSPGPISASESERSIAPGIRAIQWIEPGVAYVSFEHFDDRPEAIAVLNRVFKDYASAKALIIDSRRNHGGAFDMIGLFANHLFGEPRHLANMDIARSVVDEFGAPFPVDGQILRRTEGPAGLARFEHWAVPAAAEPAWSRVPVYYLTSRETYSAAEHMAMILKMSGRATLIGETTGGGNHFGGTEPIGGGLELFVPIGHTTDPKTGRDWEGVGIAPDVVVPADDALLEALRLIKASQSAGSPR
jgi:hypothetical protein